MSATATSAAESTSSANKSSDARRKSESERFALPASGLEPLFQKLGLGTDAQTLQLAKRWLRVKRQVANRHLSGGGGGSLSPADSEAVLLPGGPLVLSDLLSCRTTGRVPRPPPLALEIITSRRQTRRELKLLRHGAVSRQCARRLGASAHSGIAQGPVGHHGPVSFGPGGCSPIASCLGTVTPSRT